MLQVNPKSPKRTSVVGRDGRLRNPYPYEGLSARRENLLQTPRQTIPQRLLPDCGEKPFRVRRASTDFGATGLHIMWRTVIENGIQQVVVQQVQTVDLTRDSIQFRALVIHADNQDVPIALYTVDRQCFAIRIHDSIAPNDHLLRVGLPERVPGIENSKLIPAGPEVSKGYGIVSAVGFPPAKVRLQIRKRRPNALCIIVLQQPALNLSVFRLLTKTFRKRV